MHCQRPGNVPVVHVLEAPVPAKWQPVRSAAPVAVQVAELTDFPSVQVVAARTNDTQLELVDTGAHVFGHPLSQV